ncbi:adenylate/guanylate cyclase domain-containing protein [Litoribacillus peritrichatus]|uniref:adenylate/guanylate cyclase domain-containing protein n=1 Tax=Litoribacillus peritrichatus TaxID=718191 RepID=UPI0031E0A0C5
MLIFSGLLCTSTWLTWNQLDFHVRSDLQHQYRSIVKTTAEQAAQTAKPLIQSDDRLSLQVYAKESIEKRKLDSITFYSPSQEVLAYANRAGAAHITQRVTSSAEITSGSTALGSVSVVLSTEPLEKILNQTSSQIVLIALAVWVLGLILLRSLFHVYEQKVAAMAKKIQNPIATKHQAPDTRNFIELQPIATELEAFIQKNTEKNNLENSLNQLLNHQIASQISKESAPRESQIQPFHASVLYVRASGLDQLKSNLPNHEAAKLVSEYVAIVQQAAKLYNGFVEVQANGLAVIFGAPQKMNEHCLHAVCAASFLYRLLNNYNSQRIVQAKALLKFQIAIHSGDVYCFDTPEQASMAVFGDIIFEAAQLANLAKAGQILLSENARNEPDLTNKVHCKGPYNLSTSSFTCPLTYQVSSLDDNYNTLIERQVKHIASLRQPA